MSFGLGMGLVYLGCGAIVPENMQIEGFWFWLLSGAAQASVMHCAIVAFLGTAAGGCSECILCQTCTSVCPTRTLHVSLGLDLSREDLLQRTPALD